MRLVDLTGHRYGRFTVISGPHKKEGTRRVCWLSRCDCGTEKLVAADLLRTGQAQSCGCLRREISQARLTTHGMAASTTHSPGRRAPEYQVWGNMKRRCSDPKAAQYAYYGGRGIKVCERWQSFENFFADMGPRPSPRHQIDRTDNDGNYEPGNCRWVTCKENQNNRHTTRWLQLGEERMTTTDWSARTGIKADTILVRLARGWTVEKALTTPVK